VRRALARAVIAIALLGFAGKAVAEGISPGQRALLLMRVLTYDRNLRARAGGEVRVLVIYRKGVAESEAERDALLLAVKEVARKVKVAGLPIRFESVAYQEPASLLGRITELRPAALYVCQGLESAAADIARLTTEASTLSLCGSRELLRRGLAVALVDRGDRAALAVNHRAALAQGADLDSVLLALAERVESAGEP